jgi:hypothetical protein
MLIDCLPFNSASLRMSVPESCGSYMGGASPSHQGCLTFELTIACLGTRLGSTVI